MKAVILDVPQTWIDERRRLGLDRKDEMWDGVLHMVPPASSAHNNFGFRLAATFRSAADGRGLLGFVEPGVFDPAVAGMTSYRVPDLGFARPEHVTPRGIEGRAALVVEVLSPGDESLDKLGFYRHVGVEELLYVDPTTKAFEVRRPQDGGWLVANSDVEGWVRLDSLGIGQRAVGPRLLVRAADVTEEL